MNIYLFAAVILLLPALCTALGAAGVFLVRRADEPRTRRMLCGMAAGIMLAASVWSLLLPAIARSQGRAAWVPPALGLILGAVGLLRLEDAAGQLLAGGPGHCGRMVLAVTLHNLPEGMVVGLAAALASATVTAMWIFPLTQRFITTTPTSLVMTYTTIKTMALLFPTTLQSPSSPAQSGVFWTSTEKSLTTGITMTKAKKTVGRKQALEIIPTPFFPRARR